jgi:molecular chaperone GrpE
MGETKDNGEVKEGRDAGLEGGTEKSESAPILVEGPEGEAEAGDEGLASAETSGEKSGEKDVEKDVQKDVAFLEIEIEKLGRDVERARADAAQANDARIRAFAELDNVRKRTEREKDEIRKFGIESLLREILVVWDNLTRAVSHASQKDDPVVAGVELVLRQFGDVLQRFGVVPFHAIGEKFDPAKHEAISRAPMDAPEGTVGIEVACGFMLRERLFRPAMVVVSAGSGEREDSPRRHGVTEDLGEDRRVTADADAGADIETGAGGSTDTTTSRSTATVAEAGAGAEAGTKKGEVVP